MEKKRIIKKSRIQSAKQNSLKERTKFSHLGIDNRISKIGGQVA